MKAPIETNVAIDPKPEPETPMASHSGWRGLSRGDYHSAVIRLATLTQSRINHLVFASVELLPGEVRAPPEAGRSSTVNWTGSLYPPASYWPRSSP